MKIFKISSIYILLSYTFFLLGSSLYADIRDFEIGKNVLNIAEKGYVNFKCIDEKKLNSFSDFKACNENQNGLFLFKLEYDDRYAYNENFEGTQVAGHPVILTIGVSDKGIISHIETDTDPKAPFYFKKQAHLFWMRIYSKYGSDNWICEQRERKKNHLVINKKYLNKICTKTLTTKTISLHTEFYYVGEKTKEGLVSRTNMKIIANNKS